MYGSLFPSHPRITILDILLFFCLNYYTGLIERNELESEKPEFKTKDAEIRYLRDKVGLYGNTHRIDGINPK